MAKTFEKHEMLFCMLLIGVYLIVNSACIRFFGDTSWVGFVANTLLSACVIGLTVALKRTAYYGLTSLKNAKRYLYFIPLLAIASVNLWNGVNTEHTASEIVFHILTMVNIGFLEEIIFRGFLFKMMAKDHIKSAMLVSAVTFGMGHIINLLNGAEWLPTVLQIGYATAIGYLFVVIFHTSGSLIPCIVTHVLVNSLSVFNVENGWSLYVAPAFLMVVPLTYAWYIRRTAAE